jgi:hypothetical protein
MSTIESTVEAWPNVDIHTRGTLECLIDRHGLVNFLDAISVICTEKADHLVGTWQDKASARIWDRRALALRSLTMTPLFKS